RVPVEKPTLLATRPRPSMPSLRIARADLPKFVLPKDPERPKRDTDPEPPREMPREKEAPAEQPAPTPHLGHSRERSVVAGDNPLVGLGPKDESPALQPRTAS